MTSIQTLVSKLIRKLTLRSLCDAYVYIIQAAESSDNTTVTSSDGDTAVHVQKPRLLSVKGKVYDVSSSAAFGSGGPLQCLGMHAHVHIHIHIYYICTLYSVLQYAWLCIYFCACMCCT
jgi:hypothetical protein